MVKPPPHHYSFAGCIGAETNESRMNRKSECPMHCCAWHLQHNAAPNTLSRSRPTSLGGCRNPLNLAPSRELALLIRSVRQAFEDLGYDLRPSNICSALSEFVATYLTTYLSGSKRPRTGQPRFTKLRIRLYMGSLGITRELERFSY